MNFAMKVVEWHHSVGRNFGENLGKSSKIWPIVAQSVKHVLEFTEILGEIDEI